jgi:hypothetical protein
MNNVRAESETPVRREIDQNTLYRVVRAPALFGFDSLADPRAWRPAQVATVASFHSDSSKHRPQTLARVLFDRRAIHVRFEVQDRYVRSVQTRHQSRVSRDSCVEFFIQPAGTVGYYNFEVNAGGTMLVYFIEDPARGEDGALFQKFTELPIPLVESMPIYHSLPDTIDPEQTEPTHWSVAFSIPKSLLEQYVPNAWSRRHLPWRCNFHKCGDDTSHPHWASWADIGSTLRFHQPDKFGQLIFDMRAGPTFNPSTESNA